MKQAHAIMTVLHVLAGTVALLSMWVPMFSKKGGRAHRRVGWIYVWAMAIITVTAIAASSLRLLMEPTRQEGPLFLMMVAVLGGAATWWGITSLRQKRRSTPSRVKADWIAAVGLIVVGLAGFAYWLAGAMTLFGIFGALNVAIGAGFVRTLRAAPSSRWWWWFEHFLGMIVACIGTVTAFLVVNYGSAPESIRSVIPSIAVWVAPGIVGSVALTLLKRYYRARLEPGERAA